MRDKKIKKLAVAGLFTVFAAICGILEGFLPLQLIIPVPGVKLGIANIFIVFAFCYLGKGYALSVSLARVFIVFIFSGNYISLVLSLSGALFSYLALFLIIRLHNKVFSFIGISSVCSFLHGFGQLCMAYIIVGRTVMYYLPIMLIACVITGIFTGTVMNLTDCYMKKIIEENI